MFSRNNSKPEPPAMRITYSLSEALTPDILAFAPIRRRGTYRDWVNATDLCRLGLCHLMMMMMMMMMMTPINTSNFTNSCNMARTSLRMTN